MTYLLPTIHPAYLLRSKVQLSDVIAADLAKAWSLTQREPIQHEQYVVVHPSNPTPLDLLVRRAIEWMHHWVAERCTVAVDIETSGLSLFRCDLYSIALSGVDGNDLGLGFTLHDLHTLPWEAEKVLVQELRLLLANAAVPKAFHNSPFDKAVLAARGYQINGRTVDTQGLHLLVQPDIPHDLGFIGHQYLEVEPWKMSHEGTKMAHSRDIVELLVYNIKDAINTGKLIAPLCEDIYSRGMGSQVISYQMDFADLCTSMELIGLPVNHPVRQRLGVKLREDVDRCTHELRDMLNWPDFNPLNNKHRIAVYYDKKFGLSFTPGSFTPTGLPSTSYKTAKGQRSRADAPNPILENLEHPIVRRIVDCQEWAMRHSAIYGAKGAYQKCLEKDGRLHPKWNPVQLGGRATSQPNFQNMRASDREFVDPGPGRCIIVADKDQLELRIAACLCGVAELLAEMARPDGDPHTMAARYVFGQRFIDEPNPKIKKRLRGGLKNTVYAALNEASVRTVWRTVRERKDLETETRALLTLPFVNHVVHSYFGKFNFKAGHDAEWNRVQTEHFSLAYPLGIRRCFSYPELATRNEISNWRVQRTGATYATMGMINIKAELDTGRYGNSHIIVHAHDEVVIDAEASFSDRIIPMVDALFGSDVLEGPAGPVKLTAKAHARQNWKEAKGA